MILCSGTQPCCQSVTMATSMLQPIILAQTRLSQSFSYLNLQSPIIQPDSFALLATTLNCISILFIVIACFHSPQSTLRNNQFAYQWLQQCVLFHSWLSSPLNHQGSWLVQGLPGTEPGHWMTVRYHDHDWHPNPAVLFHSIPTCTGHQTLMKRHKSEFNFVKPLETHINHNIFLCTLLLLKSIVNYQK